MTVLKVGTKKVVVASKNSKQQNRHEKSCSQKSVAKKIATKKLLQSSKLGVFSGQWLVFSCFAPDCS